MLDRTTIADIFGGIKWNKQRNGGGRGGGLEAVPQASVSLFSVIRNYLMFPGKSRPHMCRRIFCGTGTGELTF